MNTGKREVIVSRKYEREVTIVDSGLGRIKRKVTTPGGDSEEQGKSGENG